jgi:hypothetical protein
VCTEGDGDNFREGLGVESWSYLCRLDACGLSHYSYQMISQVLNIPTHLKSLGLAKNKVTDQGVHPLCDALRNSRCSLNRLM